MTVEGAQLISALALAAVLASYASVLCSAFKKIARATGLFVDGKVHSTYGNIVSKQVVALRIRNPAPSKAQTHAPSELKNQRRVSGEACPGFVSAMFEGGPAAFLSRVLASQTAKVLGHIGKDTIVTMSLLGALSAIHFGLRYTGARPEFLAMFSAFHEYCFLGMYVLLALRSVMRLAKIE